MDRKIIITVKAVFDDISDADVFVDGLAALDDEGVFPTGADIKRDFDYSDKYRDVCINPQEISNA